ncbi:MAG: integrase core domain-containing protein [Chloroflexi bacterium]|nr:integrase core domain-containing protein [Chloroflexota bacterium]MDA1147800.1 integrase core domain-containing protein [Chloroflexota bacterium]
MLNESQLRRVLSEYVTHYNNARPHRSLALEPPAGPRALTPFPQRSRVFGAPVLGGLHHDYDWAA